MHACRSRLRRRHLPGVRSHVPARAETGAIAGLLSAAELPVEDLTVAMLDAFVVAIEGGVCCGVVGLEISGSDALLRSRSSRGIAPRGWARDWSMPSRLRPRPGASPLCTCSPPPRRSSNEWATPRTIAPPCLPRLAPPPSSRHFAPTSRTACGGTSRHDPPERRVGTTAGCSRNRE